MVRSLPGVRTFDGPQRLGGAVRRSREVILAASEVQEAARDRRTVSKSGLFVEVWKGPPNETWFMMVYVVYDV